MTLGEAKVARSTLFSNAKFAGKRRARHSLGMNPTGVALLITATLVGFQVFAHSVERKERCPHERAAHATHPGDGEGGPFERQQASRLESPRAGQNSPSLGSYCPLASR